MREVVRVWLAAVGVGVAVVLGAQEGAPRLDSIRQSDLRADLFFLAGDGMHGRLTNTPENALAAEWVEVAVRAAGAKTGRRAATRTITL